MQIFKMSIILSLITLSMQAGGCMPKYMYDNCSVDGYGIIEIEKKPQFTKSIYSKVKIYNKSKRKKYYVKKCRRVVRYR